MFSYIDPQPQLDKYSLQAQNMAGSTPFAAKGIIGLIHQHASVVKYASSDSPILLTEVDPGNSLFPVTMQMIDLQQLPRYVWSGNMSR